MGSYDLKGKRLLILGGNSATLDLVRFTMIDDSGEEIYEAVGEINKTLRVYNTEGEIMNTLKFDLKRIEHREI